MDKALQFPGVSNAWTMPIKARIDMLSTGIRTPVGVKVFGTDLAEIEQVARADRSRGPQTVPGTSSAYAERVIGGYYLDIVPDRDAARPLRPDGRRRAGRDRHRARRRDGDHHRRRPRALHASTSAIRAICASDPQAIASEVLVPLPNGGTVPLGEVAKVSWPAGPTTIRTENGAARRLHLCRYARPRPRRLCRRRAEGGGATASSSRPATYVTWSGQFEYLERAEARLQDRRAGDAADHLPAALSQFPAR